MFGSNDNSVSGVPCEARMSILITPMGLSLSSSASALPTINNQQSTINIFDNPQFHLWLGQQQLGLCYHLGKAPVHLYLYLYLYLLARTAF